MRTYREVLREIMTDLLDAYEASIAAGEPNIEHVARCVCWEELWDELDDAGRLDLPCLFETMGENIIPLINLDPKVIAGLAQVQ